MNSDKIFQIAMDINSPPGIIHPLLVENYKWVDERLSEMYYGYSLNHPFLVERHAWIDKRLREMYNCYALMDSNRDEYEDAGLSCNLEKICESYYHLPRDLLYE